MRNDIHEYVNKLGLGSEGEYNKHFDAYVIDILNSDEYGKMFSKLEKIDDIELLDDNQVITEQGSSLIYESKSEPYILNLIADFDNDLYQLVINYIEE